MPLFKYPTFNHFCFRVRSAFKSFTSSFPKFAKAENIEKTSNLYHTRGNTPKRTTSGGGNLRCLDPLRRSYEDTSQRWRAIGHIFSISLAQESNTRPLAPIAMSLTTTPTEQFKKNVITSSKHVTTQYLSVRESSASYKSLQEKCKTRLGKNCFKTYIFW